MKKIIIIICIALISISSFAQKKKKAIEILDQVIEKNESYENIEVEFTYKMENPDAGIDESKTGILLVKGDKYRLNIEGHIVISDGTNLYDLLVDEQEVMINSVEDNSDAITPNNLLNSYKTNYKCKFVKEDLLRSKSVQIIELTPLKGRTFSKIKVIVLKDAQQILSFSIFDKNGSMYSYIINKFTPNTKLDPKAFIFNEADYPDFEIIDMR